MPVARTCPICRVALRRAALAGVEIDECPDCKGTWFEDQELELAKDHTDHDLAWMDFEIWKHPEKFRLGERHLRCPDGHGELIEVQYAGTPVTVDYCVGCRGVWLDKGDFANTIQCLEEALTTMSASEYLRASLAEARELVTGPESFLSEWRDLRAVLRLMRFRFFVEHQGLTTLVSRIPRIG